MAVWGALLVGGAASATVVSRAQAQAPGATISTDAQVGSAQVTGCSVAPRTTYFQNDSIPLTTCSVSTPFAGSIPASIAVGARALVPSVFDPLNPASYQLAALGTRAEILTSVVSYRASLNQRNSIVTASAGARYRDVLRLGPVRPVSMRLSFELDGQLNIDPTFLNSGYAPQAKLFYSIGVQSGNYYPADSSFGSFSPYAGGDTYSQRNLVQSGQAPIASRTTYESTPGVWTYGETPSTTPLGVPSTLVTVDLGAAFFNSLINNDLYLGMSMTSVVDAPLWLPDPNFAAGGYSAAVYSDFFSTFRMVGIAAYDANGADITSDAVLGFGSMTPPPPPDPVDPTDPGTVVPEPGSVVLMATGLVGVLVAGRRRRRSRAV